jgi:hypothetical protein
MWRMILLVLGIVSSLSLISPASAQTPTTDCGLLNASQIAALVPDAKDIQQTSQVPGRCHFEWRKSNAEELLKNNQEQLRSSMQRGGEAYKPVPLWSKIEVEIRQKFATVAEAQTAFKQAAAGTLESGFGSPGPLDGQSFEKIKTDQNLIAWNNQSQTMLIQSGPYLLSLATDAAESPEKNRDLALKLAQMLSLKPE